MSRIGVRELRQHASRYLAQVKAGETVEVTERGRLIAKLVPPEPAETARDQLIAEGRLLPATRSRHTLPPPVDLPAEAPSAAEALDDLRAERL
ncbi:type II toxin-antitoxin system prevent-host-death family antitoxin [Georgenia sp. H159]|uniref:type II toxin-antitoxin system Phd/YefM family antitoxin n=1 Tax=Georgenia sp. H159 TaxID=3076115 RepID=UPI002D775CED|nr:type II toxin-antitoxin system prevent-host-death family antitoxin [Georgenia sp. H159]